MGDNVRYISGLPYIQTLEDVVETVEALLEDSKIQTDSHEEYLLDLQRFDSGLSLYEVKILFDDWKRLKNDQSV